MPATSARRPGAVFYEWVDGNPSKNAAGSVPPGLADRLVTPYVSEAKSALAEHIVADADLVDAARFSGRDSRRFAAGRCITRRPPDVLRQG